MQRKDYLKEKLSKEEKLYLKRIVMTAKNKYIQRNYHYINDMTILNDENTFTDEETILDLVLDKAQNEINSAIEFERTFSDVRLYRAIKNLSLKEKEVLFYLYKENKTINQTADIMKLYRGTVRKIRNQAHSKIVRNLIKGEF